MIDIALPCTVMFLVPLQPIFSKEDICCECWARHFGHWKEDSLSWYDWQWLSYPVLTEKHVHSLGPPSFWPPGRLKCDTSFFLVCSWTPVEKYLHPLLLNVHQLISKSVCCLVLRKYFSWNLVLIRIEMNTDAHSGDNSPVMYQWKLFQGSPKCFALSLIWHIVIL